MNKQEAGRAVRWFQKRLGIRDWRIKLFIQNEPPIWAEPDCLPHITARVLAEPAFKVARIWVSPSRSEAPQRDLFHELMHVVEKDIGFSEPTTSHTEYAWDRLAEVCETAYVAECKNGLAQAKEE